MIVFWQSTSKKESVIVKKGFKLFLIVALYSLIFASVVFHFTVDKIIPNVSYKNMIDFDIAFNENDTISIIRMPTADETASVYRIYIEKSENLNSYRSEVPYDYVPYFVVAFGETHPINFKLSNLKVNGQLVPIEKLAGSLSDSGYVVEVKDNVIHANYQNNSNRLDLYNLAKDNFIFMTREDVNANMDADGHLRSVYYVILSLLFYLVFKSLRIGEKFNPLAKFKLYIFSFIILFIVANILIFYNDLTENFWTWFYFIKNYLCLVAIPLLVYFFTLRLKFIARLFIFIVTLLFLFIIGVDHFVQSVFGTRFLFSTVGTYAGTMTDCLPFVRTYITSYCGFYYIVSLVLFSILFWTKNEFVNLSKVKLNIVVLFVTGLGLMYVANGKESNHFFNTYQVNMNGGWFSSGDYGRKYENFEKFTVGDLGYQSYEGLNQKKNVIVLLVESLSCEVTHLCGNKDDYMPNLKQIATDNVFFPSYYSNDIHTNGAIFTITTGFPLICGKNMGDTLLNEDLYLHDVIDKFHKNGYLTSYYSPAKFVIDKDKQLVLSDYDVLSSSDDQYYDNFDKPGVFGSVSDENMFDKIIFDLKRVKNKPVFIMLTTVSTHTPYITPWGTNNIEVAFNYTDYAITKFIKNLNDINYFDNGVVIITGDHRDWGFKDSDISKNAQSRISREKVPLIMIDGVNHNIVWDRVSFSHSSLAVMLEYMMLPTYERNKYQINPFVDTNNELILYQNLNNMNEVIAKYGDREDTVVLDGDQTRFEGTLFSQYEQQQILGYISWLKR